MAPLSRPLDGAGFSLWIVHRPIQAREPDSHLRELAKPPAGPSADRLSGM